MKFHLASCAELCAEHRRTASPRKRAKIAAELQRRHDEWNGGNFVWHFHYVVTVYLGGFVQGEVRQVDLQRFQFALWLPQSKI